MISVRPTCCFTAPACGRPGLWLSIFNWVEPSCPTARLDADAAPPGLMRNQRTNERIGRLSQRF
ncbi:hypothetical protein BCR44DRAFT_1441144 [Catenaria anguillulae PL171]|uniref:Uncharacterized protein n=1 Tax=Catenaria anguillulae PL171 TaxID=765915 RepID=A0A1Y2HBM5_9FUNG|nr:hypothetical protein BCR44DRAFT_1441144 [Catenaria anguillulae PL171]